MIFRHFHNKPKIIWALRILYFGNEIYPAIYRKNIQLRIKERSCTGHDEQNRQQPEKSFFE